MADLPQEDQSSSSAATSFVVCASWNPPLMRGDIRSTVAVEHNRVAVPALDEDHIVRPWNAKIEALTASAAVTGQPVKLFNGTKFRLAEVRSTSNNETHRRQVELLLGITDYRTSLGCCEGIAAYAEHAAASGLSLVEPLLSQALGVEALLVTSDNFCVLFRRSQHVADMPGWYCCPGGHPEPKNILKTSAVANMSLDEQADWFHCCTSDVIVREIFDSCVDEVVAELGIAYELLQHRGIVGIIQHATTRKPDVISLIGTSLTSTEVRQQFDRRDAEETFESDAGSCLLVKLTSDAIRDATTSYKITPASLACLELGLKALTPMP